MDISPTAIARDTLPLAIDTVRSLLPAACDPAIYRVLDRCDGDESIFGYLQLTSEIHGNGLSRLVVSVYPPKTNHSNAKPVQLIVSSGDLEPITGEAHGWLLRVAAYTRHRFAKELPAGDIAPLETLDAIIAPYVTTAKLAAVRMLAGIETQQFLLAQTAQALVDANRAVLLVHAELHSDHSADNSRLRLAVAPVEEAKGDQVELAMIGQGELRTTQPTDQQKKRAAWFFDAMALLASAAVEA